MADSLLLHEADSSLCCTERKVSVLTSSCLEMHWMHLNPASSFSHAPFQKHGAREIRSSGDPGRSVPGVVDFPLFFPTPLKDPRRPLIRIEKTGKRACDLAPL